MESSEKVAEVKDEPGAIYVSCNPSAGPVTRHALMAGRGRGVFEYIGASRSHLKPNEIIYDEKLVVMIPSAEFNQFRRELSRALGNGSLRKRSFADFKKQAEDQAIADAAIDAKLAPAPETPTPAAVAQTEGDSPNTSDAPPAQ